MSLSRLVAVLLSVLVLGSAPPFAQSVPVQTSTDRTLVYMDTVLGDFSIELFDDITPGTVANFLNYVNDGDYDGTFFHRAIPGFILQGGGFGLESDGSLTIVPSDPPIANEFSLSNIRGTIAMAKLGGDPDSATKEWFINLTDNSANLDFQNGGFTVFGRIIGDGMEVVDAIVAQPIFNLVLGTGFSNTPIIRFTNAPTINWFGGTVQPENLVTLNKITLVDLTLASTATASPASVAPGASVLFTVAVTPGTDPASTDINVSADLSSIGGSASQTLFDDSTNGDVMTGDNVFSFLATVPGDASSGIQSISVSVSDAIPRSGATSVALTIAAPQAFAVPDRGATTTSSQGALATTTVGYARIRPDDGGTTPAGVAIFGFTQNGVLVTEAGVPAAALVEEGRIFAEVNGPIGTGIAIANPNDLPATISFYFTDSDGTDFGSGSLTLGANEHISKFLNEPPFSSGESVLGTFTFNSSVPVSAIALRTFLNQRDDFLITTLPMASLSPESADTIYFPQYVDGGGATTEVVLVNPTNATISGTVQFWGEGIGQPAAEPVSLALDDGSTGSEFAYSIPARSSTRLKTANPEGSATAGSVRVTRTGGTSSPSGVAIFSINTAEGIIVSQASVAARPVGTAFRLYVEALGTPGQVGSVRSGLAIMDTSSSSNTITLELTSLDGTTVAPPEELQLPPSGHVSKFIDELFSLPDDFSGVLNVTSSSEIAMVGLRGRTNERDDFLLTTTPPANEADASTTADRYFAQIADSEGWTTQFVLFSGTEGQASSGTVQFFDQNGDALSLTLSGSLSSGSDEVTWSHDGTAWSPSSTPPECPDPLIFTPPASLINATSVLYPGQLRGNNYKAHGGLRFDGEGQAHDVEIVAPMDAVLYRGARYLEGGNVQYMFDFINECGIMHRLDHLLELTPRFQEIADTLPQGGEGQSMTTVLAAGQSLSEGETIATAVGVPTGNVFFDWGVYDLRTMNPVSSDAAWLAEHPGEQAPYGICWLEYLSESDTVIVDGLPAADQVNGAMSDYCI